MSTYHELQVPITFFTQDIYTHYVVYSFKYNIAKHFLNVSNMQHNFLDSFLPPLIGKASMFWKKRFIRIWKCVESARIHRDPTPKPISGVMLDLFWIAFTELTDFTLVISVLVISVDSCRFCTFSKYLLNFASKTWKIFQWLRICHFPSFPFLQAFPMNRLLPLCVTLLMTALSLVLHRLLFLGGYIALDEVCTIEGFTYLIR